MPTIARLIEELRKFPPDAIACAYEGEVTGITVSGPDGEYLGYIKTPETFGEECVEPITVFAEPIEQHKK